MKMRVTLHGVSYEVEVDILDDVEGHGSLSGVPSVPKFVQSHPMPTNQSGDGILPPPSRAAAGAAAAAAANAGGKTIISPVGGTIVEVKVKADESVKTGQELLIIEAMKMQTSINSPVDAVIKSVNVSAGDTVRESQVLIEFR
ncbi:MAG: hypothetical protein K2N67_04045 [Mucispirillum sp.]|nr:hypothetical protein [Mucispirillum sp.]